MQILDVHFHFEYAGYGCRHVDSMLRGFGYWGHVIHAYGVFLIPQAYWIDHKTRAIEQADQMINKQQSKAMNPLAIALFSHTFHDLIYLSM